MGGQWIMGGMMTGTHGGMGWGMMGSGWRNANGSYGMVFASRPPETVHVGGAGRRPGRQPDPPIGPRRALAPRNHAAGYSERLVR